MTELFDISKYSDDDLLKELKSYQYDIAKNLLDSENINAEQAAEKWFTATGYTNIVSFGGSNTQNLKDYWEKFKNEFSLFLCDETAYIDTKKQLLGQSGVINTVLISLLSAEIGKVLGILPSLLSPVIILMLCSVAKVGLSAYCNLYRSAKTSENSTNGF